MSQRIITSVKETIEEDTQETMELFIKVLSI